MQPAPFAPRPTAGPSPTARALAALGAAGVGGYLLIAQPLALAAAGCAVSAGVLVAPALPLVAFLGAIAIAPTRLQRLLARWTRIDLGDGGHVGASVLLAGTLFFVLGWGTSVGAALTLEQAFGACDLGASGPIRGEDVIRGVTLNLVLFTVPLLVYVSFVHGLGPVASLRALGLRSEGAPRAIAIGVVAAIAFLGALALAEAAVAERVPQEALQNDRALEIARSVTLLGAVGLAAGSALGEEIFFRGFLQPRVGLLLTALVFAVAHVSYESVVEVVVVGILALALGLLYRRTQNLWAPVATHFTFNLLNLVAAQYVAT